MALYHTHESPFSGSSPPHKKIKSQQDPHLAAFS